MRADYDRVLKQRSALLKTARNSARSSTGDDLRTLDVWDGHLARHGAALLAGRLELVAGLAAPAVEAFAEVAPSVGADRARLPLVAGRCAARRRRTSWSRCCSTRSSRVRRQEVERGVCLVGPHRDDLELRLGAGPAKGYASHGESWALALALRLASYRLLCADGVEPVLILDDVFAELDDRRRRALAGVAARAEQVLVTAAVADDVPAGLGGVRFAVSGGRIERLFDGSAADAHVSASRMISHGLWTRLWILWTTSARLVMSSGNDRPSAHVDRPPRANPGELSPGLGTTVGRPLVVNMPTRTLRQTPIPRPTGRIAAPEGRISLGRRCGRRARPRPPAPPSGRPNGRAWCAVRRAGGAGGPGPVPTIATRSRSAGWSPACPWTAAGRPG